MTEQLTPYDPAEDLLSGEALADYMTDAFETGDPAYIAYALDVAARAKGMIHAAQDVGRIGEKFGQTLGEPGNPSLHSLLTTLDALELDVSVKPRVLA